MGLDLFAIYPVKEPVREVRPAKAELAPEELFADVFTGHASFRGERYHEYVLEVTGESRQSLHLHYIRPEDVKEMTVKLQKAAEEYTDEDFEELEITREQARELARWFKVAADHGFALYCSW